jgi:DNA-binding transcriptional MerR regulator
MLLQALACLRSMGMSIEEMCTYLEGVAEGRTAAPRMVELFACHAERLEDELTALRLRHADATAKVELWQARVDGNRAAEQEAASKVLRVMDRLRDRDREAHR